MYIYDSVGISRYISSCWYISGRVGIMGVDYRPEVPDRTRPGTRLPGSCNSIDISRSLSAMHPG